MFGVTGLRLRLLMDDEQGSNRARVTRRFMLWSMLWMAGHVLGASALGGLMAWLGGRFSVVQLYGGGVLCLLCIAGALHQLGVISLPLPMFQRQVDRRWMHRFPWSVVALGYGFQLGAGIVTRINVATLYAALGCALLSGSPLAGALIMSAFGISRALPSLLLARQAAEPTSALTLALTVDGYDPLVTKWNGVALAMSAAVWAGLQLSHWRS